VSLDSVRVEGGHVVKRLSILFLVCMALFLASAVPAFAYTTQYTANFERGSLCPPWQALGGPYAIAQVVRGHAHSGRYAFEEALLPTIPSGSQAGALQMAPPQNGAKYELDGWLYVDSAYNWGMTSTPFMLILADGGVVGVHVSSDVGGTLGYYSLYTGSGTTGLTQFSFPQQTWHHVKVTYDRVKKTQDVEVDGQFIAQGMAVGTSAAPSLAVIESSGGWAPGNAMTSYIDDVTLQVTPAGCGYH
jgi:hypothetical protein